MENATPQDAPASSSFEKLKGAFKALFPLLARPDPAEAYRARLCAYERDMCDRFHDFKASHPEHRVFIGIAGGGRPDAFESHVTIEAAKGAVDALAANKYGPQPFIALDLRKSFQEQWSKAPDGSDFSSLLKTNPISRVPGLVMNVPRQAAVQSGCTRV